MKVVEDQGVHIQTHTYRHVAAVDKRGRGAASINYSPFGTPANKLGKPGKEGIMNRCTFFQKQCQEVPTHGASASPGRQSYIV